MSYLYILEINPLSVASFCKYFVPFWGLSFHLELYLLDHLSPSTSFSSYGVLPCSFVWNMFLCYLTLLNLLFLFLVCWLGFSILEKWSFVGDILCISAPYSPLVTRAICSRDAPMWAVWVLLLWRANYCGQSLVSVAGSWFGWLSGPALYGDCQPLVGGARSQGSWLWKPWGPQR